MSGFDGHVVDRESREALLLTKSTKFWVTVVSIFGVLYETSGTSVYSTEDVAKSTPSNAHSCVNYFVNAFPTHRRISPQILFEERDKGANDLCCVNSPLLSNRLTNTEQRKQKHWKNYYNLESSHIN